MKRIPVALLMPIILVIILVMVSASPRNASPRPEKVNELPGVAVVELFTSEGCSSCPPADQALASLEARHNPNVYMLSFHVDYWNRLGWRDGFSSHQYSERQQAYGSAFDLESIYTPQAIVNGSKQFTGSDEDQLRATVQQALARASETQITAKAVIHERNIVVNYSVTGNTAGTLNIAVIQLKATTAVTRGENEGRTLSHVNIVRALESVALEDAKSGTVTVALPASLSPGDVRLVAYAQQKKDMHVTGATSITIAP